MPKGLQNINSEIIERLRVRVSHSMPFPLNSNKDYEHLSQFVFEQTGAMLSSSTLRRIFQYNSGNKPTKSTLDLICKSIGLKDWEDFIEKEGIHSQPDLAQVITMFKLQGIDNHARTWQILDEHSKHLNIFNLLEAVVQIAISKKDIAFLRSVFELDQIFDQNQNPVPIIYFVHGFVISLIQSDLMPELTASFGASKNAQNHLVESYVDEDNLDGYFYDLLQAYHKNKTTPEAELFYHCLMYQRALENNLVTQPHLDFIRQFSDEIAVHHIPKGRSLAILMLDAGQDTEATDRLLERTRHLFQHIGEIAAITTALYMVKLLFIQRKDTLIHAVVALAPETGNAARNIDDLTNINQFKIYRAYSLYQRGQKSNALRMLDEFDPLMVQAFIYNHIMNDYKIISALVKDEMPANCKQ